MAILLKLGVFCYIIYSQEKKLAKKLLKEKRRGF
jgi:hypothetical protein